MTQYKSIIARANDLAPDRPDIQFAVKHLAQSMAKPTVQALNQSKEADVMEIMSHGCQLTKGRLVLECETCGLTGGLNRLTEG